MFAEHASSVAQRDQLAAALDFVREGDTLAVSRLDRLARSTADLLGILALLEGKRVALRILDFGGAEVDARSPTGRMLLTMLAAVAEFERAIRPSTSSTSVRGTRLTRPCSAWPIPATCGGLTAVCTISRASTV